MDIQAMFDAIGESARNTRSDYHLTLGGLIEALKEAPSDAMVTLENGDGICDEHSYRGYYSDLAFSVGPACTVADTLKMAQGALGETYEGYKGGDFIMAEDTPLWLASYGCCGSAIIGAKMVDGTLVLETKDIR